MQSWLGAPVCCNLAKCLHPLALYVIHGTSSSLRSWCEVTVEVVASTRKASNHRQRSRNLEGNDAATRGIPEVRCAPKAPPHCAELPPLRFA